jgi:hypothetical protein
MKTMHDYYSRRKHLTREKRFAGIGLQGGWEMVLRGTVTFPIATRQRQDS